MKSYLASLRWDHALLALFGSVIWLLVIRWWDFFEKEPIWITLISVGLGAGIWQVDQLGKQAKFGPIPKSSFVDWSIPLFVSGIVVSGIVAAVLNAVMKDEE